MQCNPFFHELERFSTEYAFTVNQICTNSNIWSFYKYYYCMPTNLNTFFLTELRGITILQIETGRS